jgi:hypothetical protein
MSLRDRFPHHPPSRCRIPTAAGILLIAVCAGLQGGCAAAVGVGTIVTTGKTPVDHVYSWIAGKNCSMVRQHRGKTYCVEDEPEIPVVVHCYPTLGEVTCYDAPDPYPGGQRKLGSSVPVPPMPVLAAQAVETAPDGDPEALPAPEPLAATDASAAADEGPAQDAAGAAL